MSYSLSPEDIEDVIPKCSLSSRLTNEDISMSKKYPVVISYSLIDMDKTGYHFGQEFSGRDTKAYFNTLKNISQRTINDLVEESDHNLHFYRNSLSERLKALLKKIDPKCLKNNCPEIYHFALYTDKNGASRESGARSPRVYFMLGLKGVIYPLFFDPYHEINP